MIHTWPFREESNIISEIEHTLGVETGEHEEEDLSKAYFIGILLMTIAVLIIDIIEWSKPCHLPLKFWLLGNSFLVLGDAAFRYYADSTNCTTRKQKFRYFIIELFLMLPVIGSFLYANVMYFGSGVTCCKTAPILDHVALFVIIFGYYLIFIYSFTILGYIILGIMLVFKVNNDIVGGLAINLGVPVNFVPSEEKESKL